MEPNNTKDTSMSSTTNNNKHLLYAGLAIIVVIAIALIVPHLHKTAPTTAPVTAATTPTVQAATSPSTETSSAFPSSWTAMLNEYSGRVVIFDAACAATPNSQVQGLGTRIALVNDSNVPHTVIFGNDTGYTIPAYHYKTVLVDNSSVINISCDGVQKAATVTGK
jgi:hypothetical protein